MPLTETSFLNPIHFMYFPSKACELRRPSFVINRVVRLAHAVSDVSVIMSVFILCLSVVYVLLRLLSSAAGRDHGVFGLREERISCLRFLLSLCPLHAPLALSGRARPLGRRRAGAPVNHTAGRRRLISHSIPGFTDKPIVLDYDINLSRFNWKKLDLKIYQRLGFVSRCTQLCFILSMFIKMI